MGILTNFLKLLKPEPNDFVDVAKHISENYDKLDQNAKSNNETLTNLSNNKLDKGTYPGNASDLKSDIDEKMSKYQIRYDIMDYDDLIEDGFYIVSGSVHGVINSPHWNVSLVQVWSRSDAVYQKAVSYYDVQAQFVRCIVNKAKNTKWEKIINTAHIVNNLTTTASGKVLDGRQGPAIVNKINGLAGGYSGTFPLTTAVKEGIYLLPATNKFYVCVENYSGSSLTAPNANFEELSVYTNRNKLENIKGFWALEPTEFKLKTPMTFTKKLIENDIVFVNMGFAPGDSSYTRTKIFTSKATSGFELSGFYAADTSQQFSFALDINTDNILVVRKTGYSTDTMIISVYVLRI